VEQVKAPVGDDQFLAACPDFFPPGWQIVPRNNLFPEIHADIVTGNRKAWQETLGIN
jgi:hypothetical protein